MSSGALCPSRESSGAAVFRSTRQALANPKFRSSDLSFAPRLVSSRLARVTDRPAEPTIATIRILHWARAIGGLHAPVRSSAPSRSHFVYALLNANCRAPDLCCIPAVCSVHFADAGTGQTGGASHVKRGAGRDHPAPRNLSSTRLPFSHTLPGRYTRSPIRSQGGVRGRHSQRVICGLKHEVRELQKRRKCT